MSGHSKWHSIKYKKAAVDAKRGNIFTKHAKLIAVAARGGGDPNDNASLRLAIDNAKADNMPNNNIERAIKKGTGEDKEGSQIEELFYEGYGPEGVAIYVHALTDNKNRTAAEVRHIFSKNGGNMGGAGCVAFLFEHKGVLYFENIADRKEALEIAAIEAGAEDLEGDEESMELITSFADFNKVRKELTQAGFQPQEASTEFRAKDKITIDNQETVDKIMKLIEILEEDDDVNEVYTNFEPGEGVTL
ncbi:MAG: YebC/PmpR family DNA-binding transcriptional regulator [Candidatus Gracilibacteria bacterium]|nr:YebC/PmpR family DNA-binding transcriptional regulator [Candidatus Gracilibacteria bacterium]